jgi:hypothetical protein
VVVEVFLTMMRIIMIIDILNQSYDFQFTKDFSASNIIDRILAASLKTNSSAESLVVHFQILNPECLFPRTV